MSSNRMSASPEKFIPTSVSALQKFNSHANKEKAVSRSFEKRKDVGYLRSLSKEHSMEITDPSMAVLKLK